MGTINSALHIVSQALEAVQQAAGLTQGPSAAERQLDLFCQFSGANAPQPNPSILSAKGLSMLAVLRFLWNATRGHRLAPWRSEYLRWRVETYSGKSAETLTSGDVLSFLWSSRWELLDYLAWIGRLHREVRRVQ
jgi:hypothetical protein